MFSRGGQRRTLEAGCGYRCVGHPTEVNKKYLLHKRYCKECGDTEYQAPEFNRDAANINGWKGVSLKQNVPNQMLTTAFVNGVRQDILLDGITNMEDAMDNARLVVGLTDPKPLSKSQKKRQKQKIKKATEDTIDELTELRNIMSGKYETEPRLPDGTEVEKEGKVFVVKHPVLIEKELYYKCYDKKANAEVPDIGKKQELLAGATYMYVPPDKLEEFLDRAEGRDHNEKELIDLLMEYMPLDKAKLLLEELQK
jgi:hypothetical protein